ISPSALLPAPPLSLSLAPRPALDTMAGGSLGEERPMEAFLIALLALLVIFLLMGVRVVRQGYVYTVERLGKFTLAAQPGLHLIIPFVDRVGQKVNVMEQVLDIPG